MAFITEFRCRRVIKLSVIKAICFFSLFLSVINPLSANDNISCTTFNPDGARKSAGFTSTVLQDGRVLVAGGIDNNLHLTSSVEIYDPNEDVWTVVASLNYARTGHTATLLQDGRVLVAGGSDFNFGICSTEIYDPNINQWIETGSLHRCRSNHTATLLQDGRVLAVSGSGWLYYLDSTEVYDPASGTWSLAGQIEPGRRGHTATLLGDGRVLVAGGFEQYLSLYSAPPSFIPEQKKAYIFNPDSGNWTSTGNLITGRGNHTANLLSDGRVLVVGGRGTILETERRVTVVYPAAEIYNPNTGTWTSAKSLNIPREYHTATSLNDGRILVTGGRDSNFDVTSSSEFYHPLTGLWSITSSLGTARFLHTATLLQDGRVFAGGKYGRSNPPVGFEIYNPTTEAWTKAGNSTIDLNILDTDGDLQPDSCDSDDDNDGVQDSYDAFPLDANETVDTDHDNVGNNADPDDDNDGLSDEEEAIMGTEPLMKDTDGDGIEDGIEVQQERNPTVNEAVIIQIINSEEN